ncbi:MAG: hypothetical protein DI543_06070 [Bradyrhizobium icense]|nr:MAG: hypothetical protein DI543_06070 [Bradyrhizobium icense]
MSARLCRVSCQCRQGQRRLQRGNLSKTESMVEAMADGDAKFATQKESSAAQDAMLAGKMGACAAYLGKAMHAGETK